MERAAGQAEEAGRDAPPEESTCESWCLMSAGAGYSFVLHGPYLPLPLHLWHAAFRCVASSLVFAGSLQNVVPDCRHKPAVGL